MHRLYSDRNSFELLNIDKVSRRHERLLDESPQPQAVKDGIHPEREANNNSGPTANHEAGTTLPGPSNKVKITCEQCGGTREVYPSYVKRGRMTYCSRECFNDSRRKRKAIKFDGDTYVCDIHGYYRSKKTRRMLHRVTLHNYSKEAA